jgi:hypothetical protein
MQIFRDFSKKLEVRLQERLNFIQVVTGPRQVGKTTGLRQIAQRWNGPVHLASAALWEAGRMWIGKWVEIANNKTGKQGNSLA